VIGVLPVIGFLDTGAIALLTGANWQIFIHSYL